MRRVTKTHHRARYGFHMVMLRTDAQSVPEVLRATRAVAGLTTREIGAVVGVSHTTVMKWERGEGEPSISQFARWADATRQDVRELVGAIDYRSEG